MKLKRIGSVLFGVLMLLVFLFISIFFLAYFKQDAIVQSQITSMNESHRGHVSVGDVHIAPFDNFPYLSLKVDDVKVFENKESLSLPILEVADIYVGLDIWDVLMGSYAIQTLTIEDGFADLVRHVDGRTNIENALALSSAEEPSASIDFHLQKIVLNNLAIHQREETTGLDVETHIYFAKGGFKTKNNKMAAHLDSQFELNIIQSGDTTYLKNKHFELHTDLTFDEKTGVLAFKPSGIKMEHGNFELEGSIDTKNEMTLDIALKGTKPSFDMFIAFAPTELIPVLERYENAGKIYFNATLKGPTSNGRQPFIDAVFGASEAYLANSNANRRMDHMGFSGHFTNGEKRNLTSMEFSLKNMTANLEEGNFIGSIVVNNFEAPEIDMRLDADFEIDFISDFLDLTDIQDASGSVKMKLKFHDIIDLDAPENTLENLNQAYFAELLIRDLSFNSTEFPAPLADLDAHLIMNGKKADLDKFDLKMGNSNLSITGLLSDLPAIIHHSNTPVNAHLELKSTMLDITELTYSAIDSTGIDEQIENLRLAFSFNALGDAFTEFQHLPKGEFFIDNLYADLKHYPHTLHDFHADILVQEDDMQVVDFKGIIDASDFHFNGHIHDYSFWMQEKLNGDVDLDVTLKSDKLKLEDLLAYGGENYIPNDYQHEEIKGLDVHLQSRMHYTDSELISVDLQLDKLVGKMHIHPLALEEFSGRFHMEDEHLMIQNLHGKMGKTVFDMAMNYYLGEDEKIKKRDNSFVLKSDFIDFDAISSYNIQVSQEEVASKDQIVEKDVVTKHEEAFNLYELPFTDMQFNMTVGHFIYHRLDLKNIYGQFRTTHNHYIHVDTLNVDAAGGNITMKGYLNGSDPKHIYLKPHMKVTKVDLDKLLFKFENFGQDAIVSENLHGQLNATITGNVRVYPDMVPDLDQSEVHMDMQVLNGRLENYDPVLMLSDYFGDKDLTKIKFDTLQNHMDITNGTISIPHMTIESTLGHMDISGTQKMNDSINYYVSVPWSLVKQTARNKLFGTKENDGDTPDEIIEMDTNKRIRYLNVNISGTFEDYSVKMKKSKK